jgi:hypothetical protein
VHCAPDWATPFGVPQGVPPKSRALEQSLQRFRNRIQARFNSHNRATTSTSRHGTIEARTRVPRALRLRPKWKRAMNTQRSTRFARRRRRISSRPGGRSAARFAPECRMPTPVVAVNKRLDGARPAVIGLVASSEPSHSSDFQMLCVTVCNNGAPDRPAPAIGPEPSTYARLAPCNDECRPSHTTVGARDRLRRRRLPGLGGGRIYVADLAPSTNG